MNNLVSDTSKDIAVFINDFDQEFADALVKLSERLGRPLRGIILLDSKVKARKLNSPDVNSVFEQVVCNFSNAAELHKTVMQFADNVLFVTCSADKNQPYLKRVLPHLPYVLGPTETSIDWATDKSEMRAMLGSYDESLVPKNITISSASDTDIETVLANLSFPMIIKPTGLASSILVTRVDEEKALRKALKKSFSVIKDIWERDRGRGAPRMIIEEFIEGDMYTIDAYVNENGQTWSLPPLRAETAYAVGLEGFYTYRTTNKVELTSEEVRAGQDAAERAMLALCLRSGVAHVELYHTKDGWKIIELGPRAGGQRQELYHLGYGIDHAYNEFLIKVGLPPEIKNEHLTYVHTINFYAEEEGIITAIEGIEDVKKHPSLYTLRVFGRPGMVAESSVNGGKIIADGIMYNDDYVKLEKGVAEVYELFKITTEMPEEG